MWPVPTIPTLIVSRSKKCVFHEVFGVIEPGGEGAIRVEVVSGGQAIHLAPKEWREYRRNSPQEAVFDLTVNSMHEAGHAVVGTLLGQTLKFASVFPARDGDGISFGRVLFAEYQPSGSVRCEATKMAVVRLAGDAAALKRWGEVEEGGERDRAEVAEMLKEVFPKDPAVRDGLMERAEAVVRDLVYLALPAVEAVSNALTLRLEIGDVVATEAVAMLTKRRKDRIDDLVVALSRK